MWILSAGAAFASRAEDLTGGMQIARSGLVLNRVTGTFDAQVTVTNRTGATVHGPLTLALGTAVPANVAPYNSGGRTAGGADFVELPLATGTLAPDASVAVTVRLLTYGESVQQTSFSVQGLRLTAANSTQLTVSGAYSAGVIGPQELAVGPGWQVEVDGVVRGSTHAAGQLQIAVLTSAKSLALTRASSEGGSVTLPALPAGGGVSAKVLVEDGKEIAAGSLLRFDQPWPVSRHLHASSAITLSSKARTRTVPT